MNKREIEKASITQWLRCIPLLLVAVLLSTGCIAKKDNEVVVLSALDREFSEPILLDLEKELDLTIRPKYDQESNKTVGLVTSIVQNRKKPQADLFWNNEILHTIRLQKSGLLDVYRSPNAEHLPSQFLCEQKQWHGFASRARVLIINTNLIKKEEWPDSVLDLADKKWNGKCAMARPLFGTTATHAAVLFASLGEEKAKQLLTQISKNAAIEGGNKQVALKVASGQYAFGITDTDDAIIELEKAEPVAIVFPDQKDDQCGALFIPNTLAIIKNGPNPERAKKLLDRLLKADIEQRLAEGASAQIPLSSIVTTKSRVEPEGPVKMMEVDFAAAADAWEEAAAFLNATFPAGG